MLTHLNSIFVKNYKYGGRIPKISGRQLNNKLTAFPFFRLHFYLPTMRLHNIITQTQSCSLLGG